MEFIKKLHKLGIQLSVIDDDLKIKAPKGVLTPYLISQIKEKKKSLLSLISNVNTNTSIPIFEHRDFYPLSPAQYRIWVLSQFEGGNKAYNLPVVFKMKGRLRVDLLTKSFRYIIGRHESLRTKFITVAGEIYQQVVNEDEIVFSIEVEEVAKSNSNLMIRQFNDEEFDLKNAPLIKTRILKTGQYDYYLLFAIHHIIGDGWSLDVFVKELEIVYNQLLSEKEVALPPLSIQYKDYVLWSKGREYQKHLKSQRDYWKKKLSGDLPILELPSYNKRPLVKTYNGSSTIYNFSKSISTKLINYCATEEVTLYMCLLAGINGLFYRYTNSTDIILGVPMAGRSISELEHQIGLYINTVAIRTTFEYNDSFKSLLDKQKLTLLEVYEHQDYPFDRLLEDLDLKQDASRSAIFDVMVVLQNQQKASIELEGLQVDYYQEELRQVSQFDMAFSFSEDADGIYLRLEYNNDIYDAQQVDALCIHLEQFLVSALKTPEQSISTLCYQTEEEKNELLFAFNDTKVEYPIDKTVIDLFRAQVTNTPNAIAVVHDTVHLTYQELEDLSNGLANDLIARGIMSKEALIGVELERGVWFVVSLLGILKAGGAYLPIDPTYPKRRIKYIKEDSQCAFVISKTYIEAFISHEKDTRSPQIHLDCTQLAYVIYTSGSTGKPKGVMIEHKSLTNLCYWHKNEYDLNQHSRATLYASVAFDASVWEVFPYLCFGGSLYPISDDNVRMDDLNLSSFLKENNISHCYLPPKVVEKLDGALLPKGLKILSGGEVLSSKNIIGCELYNNYGPTENTVVTTNYKVSKDDEFPYPIGRPIANTEIYILDSETNQLQSKGIIGELCISGIGLARGYLNRPELTKNKFIAHPYKEGIKIYKTGDLACWLPDGNIEFKGRKDTQLKMRGYRIEPGEIEYALVNLEGISQAVVTIIEQKNEKYLAAYVVSALALNIETLRDSLRDHLPEYMIPSHIFSLDAFPFTASGKIDMKSLPQVDIEQIVVKEYKAPSNEVEKKLAEIWQEVLGVEKVGINDNFFGLGGHSLKITMLTNKMNNRFSTSIEVRDVFSNPTIAALSKKIKSKEAIIIPKSRDQKYYPLNPSQLRFWALSQLEGGNRVNTIPAVFRMKGNLHVDLLNSSFLYLIGRHESLRTCFVKKDQEVYQQIIRKEDIVFCISEEEVSQASVNGLIRKFCEEEFDLSKAPLLKARVLKAGSNDYYLLFSINHIIGDGWSMEVFVKELMSVYDRLLQGKEIELPPLRIQFKDYILWSEGVEYQKRILAQGDYWKKKLSGELPVLDLYNHSKRPKTKTYNGATKLHVFSKIFRDNLINFSIKEGATLYMSLLAGINGLFFRYTNSTDIIIGAPLAGRSVAELEDQIGLYINTLPIRTTFESDDSFKSLLDIQKHTLLEAYEYPDYPLAKLIADLDLKWEASRAGIFDIMVVLQNQQEISIEFGNLQVEFYKEVFRRVCQFDMTFSFSEDAEGIYLRLEYNSDIYEAAQVELLCIHFERFMESALNSPEESISTYCYLTKEEEKEMLYTFQ